MRFVTIASILVLLPVWVSCTRTTYVPVHSREVIKDTVTAVVADSSVIFALFECDSASRVILRELSETKGKLAEQSLSISDGRVEIVTRWQTRYIDRVHEVRDTTTVVEVRTEVKTVKHVPRFFWYCFGVSLVSVLGFLLKLLRRK